MKKRRVALREANKTRHEEDVEREGGVPSLKDAISTYT